MYVYIYMASANILEKGMILREVVDLERDGFCLVISPQDMLSE